MSIFERYQAFMSREHYMKSDRISLQDDIRKRVDELEKEMKASAVKGVSVSLLYMQQERLKSMYYQVRGRI